MAPLSRTFLPAALAVVTLLGLAGCAAPAATDELFGVITPYRIDIIQGNVVTREQLAAIRPGLRRDQVRNVLGSPLLASAFHANRWDYVFTIRRQGTEPQRRSIVLIFEGDVLKSVEAPEGMPGEREFVASISTQREAPAERVLELTEEQRRALPRPAAAPTAASAPAPEASPRTTYPPLE